MAEGPYAGVRVLDFTQGVAGPMACGLLAQFGADVAKVEPPGGDRMAGHPGYLAWNCNKRRIVLDLDDTASLSAARDLLAKADVAVFDAAPGGLERVGLDGETLTGANPRLIHVWAPMFGTTGRWSQVPPSESLMQAVSAIAWAQSSWEDVPGRLITPQVAYGHAQAIAAAVGRRCSSARGVDWGRRSFVSGVHGTARRCSQAGPIPPRGDADRRRAGLARRQPELPLYQCADGEVAVPGDALHAVLPRSARSARPGGESWREEGIDGRSRTCRRRPATRWRWSGWSRASRSGPGTSGCRGSTRPASPPARRRSAPRGFAAKRTGGGERDARGVAAPGTRHGRGAGRVVEAERRGRGARADDRHDPEAIGWGPRETAAVPALRLTDAPLAGIRVLDLGVVIAGPFGPTILANYGADVIKVEPRHGDSFRTAALGFAGWNRGKRSVVLDLKDPADLERFYDLVRTSDVVVDNYRLGVSERLKIDHATLSAINPRIITCSVLGYGKTGPLAPDPGFDPLLQALSGMMAAQGGDHEPVFHTLPVNDEASGLQAAFAVMTALNARERTGRGQHVWTSLANQSVLCQSGELTWYEGRPPASLGYKDCAGTSALEGLYACEDGWIAIAATGPAQFEGTATRIGKPGLSGGGGPEPNRGGRMAGDCGRYSAAAPTMRSKRCSPRVPAVAAVSRVETTTDPWLHANGFWEEYELAGFGTVAGVRSYAEFSRTPGGFRYPAPQLGEHTEEVLAGLGRSAKREAKPEAV